VQRAVDLDDPVRTRARRLVEPVHILRDQRLQLALRFQIDEGAVSGIWIALLRGAGELHLPGAAAHLGVAHVVLDRRHLLGLGILRPQTLRSAEVLDTGVGRDARSGQDRDALGCVDQGPRCFDLVHALSPGRAGRARNKPFCRRRHFA
jgi:hypothetical protein